MLIMPPDLPELEEEIELWDVIDHEVPMSLVVGLKPIDDAS